MRGSGKNKLFIRSSMAEWSKHGSGELDDPSLNPAGACLGLAWLDIAYQVVILFIKSNGCSDVVCLLYKF